MDFNKAKLQLLQIFVLAFILTYEIVFCSISPHNFYIKANTDDYVVLHTSQNLTSSTKILTAPNITVCRLTSQDRERVYCTFNVENKSVTLYIQAARKEDGKRYILSSIQNESFYINIMGIPFHPQIDQFPHTPSEGTTCTFTCKSSSSSVPTQYPLRYTWTMNSKPLTNHSRYHINGTYNENLVIHPVQRSDTDIKFGCRAHEDHGQQSDQILVTVDDVYYKPDIHLGKQIVKLQEGSSNGKLYCQVLNANPNKVSFKWYYTTVESPYHRQLTGNGQTFTFTNVSIQDQGQYYCTASNVVGKAYSNPVLIVLASSKQRQEENKDHSVVPGLVGGVVGIVLGAACTVGIYLLIQKARGWRQKSGDTTMTLESSAAKTNFNKAQVQNATPTLKDNVRGSVQSQIYEAINEGDVEPSAEYSELTHQ